MYGREKLDVNKLVYVTDIDTVLVDCEGTEVWPQDNNGCEYYFKSQADKAMDAMEQRIKELEADAELDQKKRLMLCNGYNKKCERVKELEKENAKLKCLVLHAMSEYFYLKAETYTEIEVAKYIKVMMLATKTRKAYLKAKKALREGK